MESYISLISGFIGALIGGMCSILGVILAQHFERKQRKEDDERKMQMFMLQKNREAKEKLYIALAQILERIEPNMVVEPGFRTIHFSQVEAEKNHKALLGFLKKNSGMFSIFCPPPIYGELMKLTSELYKASTEEQKVTIEDLKKIKDSYMMQAQHHAIDIVAMIKQDLNIADIPSK